MISEREEDYRTNLKMVKYLWWDNVGKGMMLKLGQCWNGDGVEIGSVGMGIMLKWRLLTWGQCWSGDIVETGILLILGQCWSWNNIDIGTVLEWGYCIFRDSVGVGIMLILGQCWSEDKADAGTMLEWEQCWSGDSVRLGIMLILGQCWNGDNADCAGIGTILKLVLLQLQWPVPRSSHSNANTRCAVGLHPCWCVLLAASSPTCCWVNPSLRLSRIIVH